MQYAVGTSKGKKITVHILENTAFPYQSSSLQNFETYCVKKNFSRKINTSFFEKI